MLRRIRNLGLLQMPYCADIRVLFGAVFDLADKKIYFFEKSGRATKYGLPHFIVLFTICL